MLVHAPFVGCTKSENDTDQGLPKTVSEPGPSLTLRVLVVNEPELAEAIHRLRGEWSERGTGQMETTSATWASVAAAKSIDADVVVFPSRYLGELSVRGLLRPVRANVLASQEFRADDLFPLVRQRLMKWGGQTMAVPLGAQLISPQGDGQNRPALVWLARTAPEVVSRERLSVLFDSETMKPRIAEPVFVEALGEMVASSKLPDERKNRESAPTTSLRSKDGRQPVESIVPVIGYGDRLAAVTASSRNAASAFKLLEWLARAETSSQFAAAGARVVPVRRSLVSSARWYDAELTTEERAALSKTVGESMSSDECLMIPRIPGVDEYLEALDEAVASATSKGVALRQALETAARRWDEITEARGRDAQRTAFLKHLGIGE
jgi:hypothetical protein